MKVKILLLSLLLFAGTGAVAQNTGGIKGKVVTRSARQLIDGAKVTLNTPVPQTLYAAGGAFEFTGVSKGVWELIVEAPDFIPVKLTVKVEEDMRDINFVSLSFAFETDEQDISFIPEFDSEGGGYAQEVPVTLSASRDIFDNIASYKFGLMRFRNRGYETGTSKVYLNGFYMNDAQSGYTPWSLWGGLNEATRNQSSTSAMSISDYGVGSINGTTSINATASQLRKGWHASVVNASGQYLFRGMITYASEESKKGWTYALSFSTRQGGNFWVNGVSYNAWAYFGSLEKRINDNSRIALTVFGAPVIRGVQGASTQEVYDMVGSNYYNPNWGYMNGTYKDGRMIKGDVMRNARERHNHEPVAMLNYSLDLNTKNRLLIGAAYRFGRNGYSALDWYDTQDPRPDYYRYLPSYFDDPTYASRYNSLKAGYVKEGWNSDWNVRQINWDAIYNINRNSEFYASDGLSVPAGTRRSKYVIEDRRTDQQDINLKAQLVSLPTNRIKLNEGIEYRWNQTEYFKVLKDLLGGDVWLDIDQFAERDFGNDNAIQNDFNNPNRLIYKGDKYGYNYFSQLRNERLWTTLSYNRAGWETYVAMEGGHTRFWRDGQYKKGLFPDNSYGVSEKKDFWVYSLKAGATYKISGQHIVWANIGYIVDAPHFQRAMVSPRTRNDFLPGLTTEKTASADLNYSLRLSWLRMRLSGYHTIINDQTDVISFYNDLHRTFCNFAMRGINQSHTGMELGVEVPLIYDIKFRSALNYGYYIYTSNPTVTETADNSNKILVENETVYWKNYKISGTPQTAASIGLDYRSRRNLFLGMDVGFYDANYISMNPLRRTDVALVNLNNEQIKQMTKQEMFSQAFVLNANLGKVWYLGRYMLGFNIDAKNILNNKNIKTGGYEQMRLDRNNDNRDFVYYKPFDSKYYYLFGTTYYLNIYLRF